MSSFTEAGSTEPLQPPGLEPPNARTPGHPTDKADPYDATVEQLFLLLEENQAAIATLAQAWRHTRRALEQTRAELSRTRDALADERQIRRQSA
jgi:hypothetical protein